MNGLRVIPTYRHGRERLYVCLPDGRNLAWYDRESARVNLLGHDREEDVLTALGPFLTGPVSVGPPPVPTPADLARLALHPDDDLAPNRPGEALLVALDRDPAPAHRLRPDPRRRALTAERTVGAALDRLDGAGWRTLHSIPLPGGHRVHHLLIGPGGLYAVHALYAHKQRVTVADPRVALGRHAPQPLLRRVRSDAGRTSYALTAEVAPVLVLVGAAQVGCPVPPREVRVLTDAGLDGLTAGAGS
ncbi:NERD domain-containing protein [Streptomyces sp. KM77-8]|uniref:NERD domain-containing protein n=1 Tax=Streptomyces haneummycinicus TaxID=3074435 RepID=A0AAT9HD08_9ACTN